MLFCAHEVSVHVPSSTTSVSETMDFDVLSILTEPKTYITNFSRLFSPNPNPNDYLPGSLLGITILTLEGT